MPSVLLVRSQKSLVVGAEIGMRNRHSGRCLARVVGIFGATHPHHAYLFAIRRSAGPDGATATSV